MRLTRWLPQARIGVAASCLLVASTAATGQAPVAMPAPPGVVYPPVYVAPEPVAGPATQVLTEEKPTPPPPPPFGGPLFERPKLTGDWGGARETLRDHGITADLSATNFYQGVSSGGLERAYRYGGRADLLLNVDGEKAGLPKGMFLTLHAETLYGRSANDLTGALLPISLGQSVPLTSGTVTALTGVKLTQFLSETLLVYAGKINTADDFNQPFTGGARGTNGFMNAGLLIPPVFARTVPYSTFGAGFAVLSDLEPVLAVSVYDTNNTPTVSGFDTFFDRGATVLALGTLPTKFFDRPGHYSVGGAYSNTKYAALDDLPFFLVQRLRGQLPALPRESGSWSVVGLFDQTVWTDECDPKRSWGVFGHAGISDGNPNPIRWSASVGVGGASPLANRKLDTFGVGYFYVGLSDDLKNLAPQVLPLGDEHGVEFFYNVGLTPWCHLTPDLQVITPIRSRVDTSVNFGIRAKIDF